MSYNATMTFQKGHKINLGTKRTPETIAKMRKSALENIKNGKHFIPDNNGKQHFLGKTHTPEARERIRQSKLGINNPNYGKTGELSHQWKGDNVGYFALHDWVTRQLGKPNKCENCKSTTEKRFEWANISGEYKRDIGDWVRLCKRCHNNFDDVNVLDQRKK